MTSEPSSAVSFTGKIAARSLRCGVIGLGYVGLPLLVRLAEAGFQATGYDVQSDRIARLREGRSYIGDIADTELSPHVASGLLTATDDPDVIPSLDTINICVPTPLSKSREPDMAYVVAVLDTIAPRLRPDQLIILESTTYPGTTEEMVVPRLEASGLVCGRDFYVAFSPERIDPGNEAFPLRSIPKVVGGVTPTCTALAAAFYAELVDRVVPVSSVRTAEMAKLLENTFRIVNIGMINELALLADDLDVDIWEVVGAAATKPFGFMPFYPGPGLGGHCIPVDPYYLTWKAREAGREVHFIELAGTINRRMPDFVVEKVVHALNDHCKSVRESRLLMLGVTYKRDVADIRESPALPIMQALDALGGQVLFHDPYVETLNLDGKLYECSALSAEALQAADCVIVTTNHSSYDFEWIVEHAPLVVDTRNATSYVVGSKAHVYRLGASRPTVSQVTDAEMGEMASVCADTEPA